MRRIIMTQVSSDGGRTWQTTPLRRQMSVEVPGQTVYVPVQPRLTFWMFPVWLWPLYGVCWLLGAVLTYVTVQLVWGLWRCGRWGWQCLRNRHTPPPELVGHRRSIILEEDDL